MLSGSTPIRSDRSALPDSRTRYRRWHPNPERSAREPVGALPKTDPPPVYRCSPDRLRSDLIEAPFLIPVQGIVGGIQIQNDLLGSLLVRFQKQIHQQCIDALRIDSDPI